MNNNEQTFLNMIKPTIINECNKNRFCPSIIAMISIIKSNFATTREAAFARNLFNLPIDELWFGMCYSKNSGKIYNKRSECREVGPILYKAYKNYNQSIEDFINYIVTKRRSKNGPLKYQFAIEDFNYKSCIDKLIRAGFMQDYFRLNDDIKFIQDKMINIIEKYKLYLWDSEIKEKVIKNNIIEKENKINMNMYRVRLSWDNPDSQIYASAIYEDALKMAFKHEGYKVFINDNGEIFFDPWDRSVIVEPDNTPKAIPVVKPETGKQLILNKRAVYKNTISSKPDRYVSGTFYFYDNIVYNGRAKITTVKGIETMKPDPNLIYGYINIR